MLSHYSDCCQLYQTWSWSDTGSLIGTSVSPKPSQPGWFYDSRKLDNFLTALDRAESALITSTSFISVISLSIIQLKQLQWFSSVSKRFFFTLQLSLLLLGGLNQSSGRAHRYDWSSVTWRQWQHWNDIISNYVVEISTNAFSLQQGIYSPSTGHCRVPLGRILECHSLQQFSLKAASREGHVVQSAWLGDNWTCKRQ